ncbi:MAG: hypothetical protein FJ143_07835 [Deltaproteobacteria bacterium]|nr:hypothetical protein [Deltaproteobacteria bacterium]
MAFAPNSSPKRVTPDCRVTIPDVGFVDRYGEIAKPGHVEVNAGIAEELFEDHRAVEHADLGAVFGAPVVDIVSRDNAAGPGHVGDGERGSAWNEAAEVTRDQARVDIGAAARWKADDDAHDFAAIKLRHGALVESGAGALRCGQNEQSRNDELHHGGIQADRLIYLGAIVQNGSRGRTKTTEVSVSGFAPCPLRRCRFS